MWLTRTVFRVQAMGMRALIHGECEAQSIAGADGTLPFATAWTVRLVAEQSNGKKIMMRSTHRSRGRRVLLTASLLLGLTATTTMVTAPSASAMPNTAVCDFYAEHGIFAASDELVHTWWAWGHAAGCW